jgi:hypothetical protein
MPGQEHRMQKLILHPDCAPGSITQIEAALEANSAGCRVTFVARGDLGRIAIPVHEADRGRFDNLWKTTCFEIFWQPEGGTYYREFNLSPSTRWGCYDFDDFRAGMRNAPAHVDIDLSVSDTELRLTADILSDLPRPANVALNGIIEDADGKTRFWALAFEPGKPEFHSTVCRALAVPA